MIIRCMALMIAFLFGSAALASGEHSVPVAPEPSVVVDREQDQEFLGMLKDRNFDALERRLGDIQRAYEADTEKEFSMNDAFAQLAVPDPDLEKVFEEWVSSHPSSYVANTAAGAYYLDMAGAWRGTKFIAGTPQWKLDRMGRYVEKAGQSLKRSLAMSQKPTLSYALLIRAARLNGIVKESAQWLYEAITRDPHCVLPRNAHMAQLEPRWGGSYGAMQEFADETGKEQHPKLKKAAAKYQGWVQWYRGVELSWNNDYVEALKYFNSALARAEDTKFLVDRAGLYKDIGQTGLAMADVDRALELAPHNLQASYLKSMMLLDKHQVEEGMKGLLRLARMSDHDAMTQLGYIYKDGAHGIPINLAESIFWLKKVAYFGDDYACFQLGGMYSHGEGVPVDMKAAVEYFKVAASLGNALAMNDLGLMYWHGKGVPVDHRTATELWVKASDKGAWQANHNLRFFLRPHELILLAMYHPQIILKIKSLLWLILASMALVLLLTHMIIKNIKKRQSEKNMDFQFTDKLK